jgi:hypothetical protein
MIEILIEQSWVDFCPLNVRRHKTYPPPTKETEAMARVKTLAAAAIYNVLVVYDQESSGPRLL